jgi:hypothetical protein
LKTVEFKDHSEESQSDQRTSHRKRKREIPLPDRHYIRIHAAVAGILHMSAAGKFFDKLLAKFGDQDGSSVIRRLVTTPSYRYERASIPVEGLVKLSLKRHSITILRMEAESAV